MIALSKPSFICSKTKHLKETQVGKNVLDHGKKRMKQYEVPSKHNNSKGSSLDPFLSKTVPSSSLPMYVTEDINFDKKSGEIEHCRFVKCY